MRKAFVLVFAMANMSAGLVLADTVQLKDNASISGKILAEKQGEIALDLGYTVLVIPRSQITRFSRDSVSGEKPQPNALPAPLPSEDSNAPEENRLYNSAAKTPPSSSVRELVKTLGEAVVQVRTPAGLGSGFFIHEDGFLITNFHVTEGETQIAVEVYHQAKGQLEPHNYRDVRIIAINKFADLALLKVSDKGAPKFRAVPLGSSDQLAVGERVFAVGSPLGLERTVTEGILSTKTRQLAGELYLQTTAQINPGNSGGPLFNLSGEVVGVTNMKVTFGEGIGFAIPVEAVKYFLNHRDAYAYSNENPSAGYRYLAPPSRNRPAHGVE